MWRPTPPEGVSVTTIGVPSPITDMADALRCTVAIVTYSRRTDNSVHNILYNRPYINNTHARSDIYQLKCHTCDLYYIGQTASRLE
jgi:hypothetical protein